MFVKEPTTPKPVLRSIVSRASIAGHPVHPILIHFPVAALVGLLATDIAFILTEDPFWARAGLWLAGVGAVGGTLSGLAGLADIVLVRQIRRLITAWSHAILAVMLLSLASLNWLLRSGADPGAVILPWGFYLSFISGIFIALASYLGGQLVYEHAVGVDLEEAAQRGPNV